MCEAAASYCTVDTGPLRKDPARSGQHIALAVWQNTVAAISTTLQHIVILKDYIGVLCLAIMKLPFSHIISIRADVAEHGWGEERACSSALGGACTLTPYFCLLLGAFRLEASVGEHVGQRTRLV